MPHRGEGGGSRNADISIPAPTFSILAEKCRLQKKRLIFERAMPILSINRVSACFIRMSRHHKTTYKDCVYAPSGQMRSSFSIEYLVWTQFFFEVKPADATGKELLQICNKRHLAPQARGCLDVKPMGERYN